MIPDFEELVCLDYSHCDRLVFAPSDKKSHTPKWVSDGCTWLDPENVRVVIKIQKWVRKRILGNKLLKLIPLLMPIYYHYSAKGGYFHKKAMLGFLKNIENEKSSTDAQ